MSISTGMFHRMSTGFNLANPNLIALGHHMTADDVARLRHYIDNWNFYDGFHYETIEPSDKPEVTQNWCRRFVNKFVSSEFNSGFTMKFNEKVEETVLPFIDEVWDDNKREVLCQELGQMKSVTGDAFIHVFFEPKYLTVKGVRVPNPDFNDPFDEYENGRIRLFLIPSSICYPVFKDGYDTGAMESCTVMFPVRQEAAVLGSSNATRYNVHRYIYTADYIDFWIDDKHVTRQANPYGIIPIVHFKNLPLSGRHFGLSDLDDIIPINVEMNLKNSDTSEILDYHAAPVTAIFGARIGQLEKGANKVWGGLPKDAKIQNIELNSDLSAASDYRESLKKAMLEVGGMPELALGGGDVASNLSGIALHIAFMPLTDTITTKRTVTKEAIKLVNKIIIKVGIVENLFTKPADVSNAELYRHEVIFGDILPKDMKIELEQIQMELKAGLESRKNALKRLKKDNIEALSKEIDEDRDENPLIYGVAPVILTAGQQLINPETGEEIASNDKDMETLEVQGAQQMDLADKTAETQMKVAKQNAQLTPKTAQPASKGVGQNKEGKDRKMNSGLSNKNPGSQK